MASIFTPRGTHQPEQTTEPRKQIIFKVPNTPGPTDPKEGYEVSLASAVSIAAESGNLIKYYSKIYGVGIAAATFASNINAGSFQTDYNVPEGEGPDGAHMMSSMLQGMPVMFPLTMEGGTYASLQGANITYPDITFETVVCSISTTKNIQKTIIQGRNSGSVKEMISMGDFMVEVRAIIPSLVYGRYPHDEIDQLWRVIQAPVSIPILSLYLNQYGINWLTIEGFSTEQIPGEYSHVRLVLNCCSDNPLIIKTVG